MGLFSRNFYFLYFVISTVPSPIPWIVLSERTEKDVLSSVLTQSLRSYSRYIQISSIILLNVQIMKQIPTLYSLLIADVNGTSRSSLLATIVENVDEKTKRIICTEVSLQHKLKVEGVLLF